MEPICTIKKIEDLTLDNFVQCILEDFAAEIQEYRQCFPADQDMHADASIYTLYLQIERIILRIHDFPPPLNCNRQYLIGQ